MDTIVVALSLTLFTIVGVVVLGPRRSEAQLTFGVVMFVAIMLLFIRSEMRERSEGSSKPFLKEWKKLFGFSLALPAVSANATVAVCILVLLASGCLGWSSGPFVGNGVVARRQQQPTEVLQRTCRERVVLPDDGLERRRLPPPTLVPVRRRRLRKRPLPPEDDDSDYVVALPRAKAPRRHVRYRQEGVVPVRGRRLPGNASPKRLPRAAASPDRRRGSGDAGGGRKLGVRIEVNTGQDDPLDARPKRRRRRTRAERNRVSSRRHQAGDAGSSACEKELAQATKP